MFQVHDKRRLEIMYLQFTICRWRAIVIAVGYRLNDGMVGVGDKLFLSWQHIGIKG